MNSIYVKLTLALALALRTLQAAPQSPATAADTKFDLLFSGGTVAELVARVHRLLMDKEQTQPLNITVTPQQASTPIPPLHLQEISFRELAAYLRVSSRIQAENSVQAGRAAQCYGFDEAGGVWFFTVKAQEGVGRAQVVKVAERAAVYRVKAAPDTDVVGMLAKTWEEAGRQRPQHLHWQPTSQVLVLRGSEADHALAAKAIDMLPSLSQSSRAAELKALKSRYAELKAQLRELDSKLEALQK